MIEILQKIPRNIGFCPVFCNKKEWVATAAMLAASAASSIYGGISAASAAKKAKRENTYRRNAEKAWYDKEYNTDYLDTKAGQNLMRRAQEVQDNYIRKADGAAAVGGGTAASVAQAKEAANRTIGDTVANVAAQDTSRKQQVNDQHRKNVTQLSMERQQIEQNRAQATSQAAQNMSNALMQAGVNQLGSELEEGNKLGKSALGNSGAAVDSKNVTGLNESAKSVATNNIAERSMTNAERNNYRLRNAVGASGILG